MISIFLVVIAITKCQRAKILPIRVLCLICLEKSWITVTIKKIPAGKCNSYMRMLQMNPPNDWLRTGWARDSQTCTWLVYSLFCVICSLKNNAFSVLHYVIKVTLHYLMLHCFKIHSVLELSCTALGCLLAIHVILYSLMTVFCSKK